MAKNYIIDAATARGLLTILELRGEVREKDLNWALSIIHQIPGYEKTSIIKAAGDSVLREKLIAIASEEIAPTSPKDLGGLLEEAKKRESLEKATQTEKEKRAKDSTKAVSPKEGMKESAQVEELAEEVEQPIPEGGLKIPSTDVPEEPAPLGA
ncbi:hypothetical protein HY502_01005, partial [Candidatus Woesebacteria bacterium]|nr:hypothetical protein [Candidatus Woesebacteria bacterium]